MPIISQLAILLAALAASSPPDAPRPRLLILTDISSLTAGVAEPDDGQSLIRLMLYANEFDIEGLVASSNLQHGQRTRPDLIRRVVDAYEKVRPNLVRHDPRYPPADALRAVIRPGQPVAGPRVPVEASVGQGKDTEASRLILARAERPDPRPLWVLIWGGSADLAQAVWRARHDLGPESLRAPLSRLRVHAIGDQDATGPWIKREFSLIYVITQRRAYRGLYRGGDRTLVSPEWVSSHIHGHGALGDLYPSYRGGDIWSGTLGPVRGIKEGDTPSFLALVPNGLWDPDHPWLGSWGGRFAGKDRRLTDLSDSDPDTRSDPDPRMSSVYRWRPAFQADFAARLDWCVKPYDQANHPPVVRIDSPPSRAVRAGDSLTLDASGSSDPDGHRLTFAWSVYPPDPGIAGSVTLHGEVTARLQVAVGLATREVTIPLLLAVTDDGSPPLTRYGRVLLRTGPAR